MSTLVDRYAAVLRALVPIAQTARYEGAECYVSARDLLRGVAPCGACAGKRLCPGTCVCYGEGLCLTCCGAGWSQASLDAHIVEEQRLEDVDAAVIAAAEAAIDAYGPDMTDELAARVILALARAVDARRQGVRS